jgi:hypothetical protein
MQGRLQIIHYSLLLNGSAVRSTQKGDEYRRVKVFEMNTVIAYHSSWALSRAKSAQRSGRIGSVLSLVVGRPQTAHKSQRLPSQTGLLDQSLLEEFS